MFNLATILRESAKQSPDKPVTLLDGNPMSYAELDAASDRAAAGLQNLGITPGDCVGIQLPNIPQFLITYFAVLKAGAVAVPIACLRPVLGDPPGDLFGDLLIQPGTEYGAGEAVVGHETTLLTMGH